MLLQQHKIVFGGTMGAGKSEAIKMLSDIPVIETEAINTDIDAHSKYLTTVGIDYGEIILDEETKIGLYGTPGQEREPYRVCRRPTFLRECPDDKTKIYP